MSVNLDRVIIIGAGIGGLCAAIGLRRLGIAVEVYEQAPAFGAVGAGLTLWANAIKALRGLGIAEESLGGARVCRSVSLNQNGRILTHLQVDDLEAQLGAPNLAVHRADLHQALLSALPPGTVRAGAVFTGFEPLAGGVIARFADGSQARGSLLIGADGIHSSVRQSLFPAVRLRYAGYAAWRGIVENADPAMLEQTSETWGCGARFGIVPIGANRIYWFAGANLPAGIRRTPAEHKADLRSRFLGWHAPVEALIEATPAEKILYNDILDFPPLPHWSQGPVTLLGDAAHATTPNIGQGACQAIESSLVLARCLSEESSLPAALQRYERERQPRTAWITNTSWQLGKVAQVENPWLCALRDFAVRLTPPSVTVAQLMKVIGYEA